MHDPDVKFEEYYWYAQRTREEEKNFVSPKLNWREVLLRKKNGESGEVDAHASHLTEKDFGDRSHRLEISDEEWTNASRMFRTASWGACQLTKVRDCTRMLTLSERLLLDHHRHLGTIWRGVRDGDVRLGSR